MSECWIQWGLFINHFGQINASLEQFSNPMYLSKYWYVLSPEKKVCTRNILPIFILSSHQYFCQLSLFDCSTPGGKQYESLTGVWGIVLLWNGEVRGKYNQMFPWSTRWIYFELAKCQFVTKDSIEWQRKYCCFLLKHLSSEHYGQCFAGNILSCIFQRKHLFWYKFHWMIEAAIR